MTYKVPSIDAAQAYREGYSTQHHENCSLLETMKDSSRQTATI